MENLKTSPDGVVLFEPGSHTYKTADGTELISVSHFLKLFAEPFDPTGAILKRCAAKKGITEEELRAEWDKTRDESCTRGTSIHESLESYIKNNTILDNEHKPILEEFSKVKFTGELATEIIIYNEELKIAGTSDLVETFPNDDLSVYDFKTNKDLYKPAYFGAKFLYPVNDLDDTIINKYTLQLSTYAYLLELEGKWAKDLTIFYIDHENAFSIVPLTYLRGHVERMIEYYLLDIPEENKLGF